MAVGQRGTAASSSERGANWSRNHGSKTARHGSRAAVSAVCIGLQNSREGKGWNLKLKPAVSFTALTLDRAGSEPIVVAIVAVVGPGVDPPGLRGNTIINVIDCPSRRRPERFGVRLRAALVGSPCHERSAGEIGLLVWGVRLCRRASPHVSVKRPSSLAFLYWYKAALYPAIKLTALRCPVKWTRMHGRTEEGATSRY